MILIDTLMAVPGSVAHATRLPPRCTMGAEKFSMTMIFGGELKPMTTVDRSREDWSMFKSLSRNTPIQMLNLIKLRDRAD